MRVHPWVIPDVLGNNGCVIRMDKYILFSGLLRLSVHCYCLCTMSAGVSSLQ